MFRTIVLSMQLACLLVITHQLQTTFSPTLSDQTLLYLENRIGRLESKVDDTTRQVTTLKQLSARGQL
ncbi:MAG TPA: hypothetical protein DCR78_20250 [Pseudomonas sp.]|nr:hypothetical protein [Pseudomonas sp.]HAW22273.1 hypothetical protein [Pseudomonas sp.]